MFNSRDALPPTAGRGLDLSMSAMTSFRYRSANPPAAKKLPGCAQKELTKEQKKALQKAKIAANARRKLEWLMCVDPTPEHERDSIHPCPKIKTIYELWTEKEFLIVHDCTGVQVGGEGATKAAQELRANRFRRPMRQVEELWADLQEGKLLRDALERVQQTDPKKESVPVQVLQLSPQPPRSLISAPLPLEKYYDNDADLGKSEDILATTQPIPVNESETKGYRAKQDAFPKKSLIRHLKERITRLKTWYMQEELNDIREMVHEHGKTEWKYLGQLMQRPPSRVRALYMMLPEKERCKPKWSRDEITALQLLTKDKKHKDKDGNIKWYDVAMEMPGRSPLACKKFLADLNKIRRQEQEKAEKKEREERRKRGEPEPAPITKEWTAEEEGLLMVAVCETDPNKLDFEDMVSKFPGWTAHQITVKYINDMGFGRMYKLRHDAHPYDYPNYQEHLPPWLARSRAEHRKILQRQERERARLRNSQMEDEDADMYVDEYGQF